MALAEWSERDLRAVWRKYLIAVKPTHADVSHSAALYLIDGDGFERAALPGAVTRRRHRQRPPHAGVLLMEWPSDPWLIATLLIAAVWFQRGSRRPSLRAYPGGRRRTRRDHLWRGVAFYAALVTILFALGSLDRLSEELFSVHMAQHILLMLVAAPLLALAAPWNAFWRPLPLGFRRAVAGGVAHSRTLAPGRRFVRWLALPIPVWLLFNANLAAWHVRGAYDLTLSNPAVHYLEHLSFIAFGVLFWAQMVDSPPFRSRLSRSLS